jgi:tRNA pseudouridine55 synthase
MNLQHGFLIVDKPSGVTSHDVVAQIRRRFATKRVGHAGTLDPMATGVLVIGINNGTKFLQYIMEGEKRYLATIQLGTSTTTDDKEGEILERKDASQITDFQIEKAIQQFIGAIKQVPSSVSAVKIAGKRAYELVRKGESVEIPAREVEIKSLLINSILRNEGVEVDIDVTCSAGTYIRAIARDLGRELSVGGNLVSLRRIAAYPFEINVADAPDRARLLPLTETISKILPLRHLKEDEISKIRHGQQISKSDFSGPGVAVDNLGEAIAIIKNSNTAAQPVTVLNS